MPAAGRTTLRDARRALLADTMPRGVDFGRALSSLLDASLQRQFAGSGAPSGVALCALGSYARRELCPGSDVDVLLVHERAVPDALVEALWYPLWDAGFVLGHATRTVKEAIALADSDLDTLTALLDARVVAGDAGLAVDLVERARRLAPRRRRRLVSELAEAAARRTLRPGPVAEMLEPNVKDGAGGLRDIQSLHWAGWALGEPGGVGTLVTRGFLRPDDPERLERANALLLDVRVALHRVTKRESDLLALQDQDGVAEALGRASADALVRELAGTAREVAWVAADAWDRLRAAERGPVGRIARTDRPVAADVVLRDRRVAATLDATVDASLVLRVATAAAAYDAPIDRSTLERLAAAAPPVEPWPPADRDTFVALLRSGRRAVPVFEALDHVGVLARLLPQWEHVRSLPQRNAYHRFTVDRHLLEAVAEAVDLLDGATAGADESFEASVARDCPDPRLLLLGALLHDVAKGYDDDHATIGATTARSVAIRLGLDADAADTLAWLVQQHLFLAETATRRDLADPAVIDRVARAVGDPERLRLLYLLTVADSRATGPAAWNASKASLLRELYTRTHTALVEGGDSDTHEWRVALEALLGRDAAPFLDLFPASYGNAFAPAVVARHAALFARGEPAAEWEVTPDGRVRCTVVTDDRPGLLASSAAALTLAGMDIHDALAFTRSEGSALEVFTGADRFGRLADEEGRDRGAHRLLDVLAGEPAPGAALTAELAAHVERYRRGPAPELTVVVDDDASERATVIEVHGRDEVGLLARLAQVIADEGLDIDVAKVATTGEWVVDVFYVRERDGTKPVDPVRIDALRAAITTRVGGDAS